MNTSARHTTTTLRAVAAAALGVALVVSTVLVSTVLANPVGAETAPPWEVGSPPAVSPNEVGGLTFYNSSGQVITSGTISDDPIAAYVQGNTALQSDGTKAELSGFTPVIDVAPGAWNGVPFFNSPYPNAAAPTALADSTLPLYTGVSGYSLSALTESYPTTTHRATATPVSTCCDSRPSRAATVTRPPTTPPTSPVNPSTGAWALVDSPLATTTTTLATPTPSSPQPSGTPVTLNASVVDASVPGTVQFESDGNDVGSPVTVDNGAAQLVTTTTAPGPVTTR